MSSSSADEVELTTGEDVVVADDVELTAGTDVDAQRIEHFTGVHEVAAARRHLVC